MRVIMGNPIAPKVYEERPAVLSDGTVVPALVQAGGACVILSRPYAPYVGRGATAYAHLKNRSIPMLLSRKVPWAVIPYGGRYLRVWDTTAICCEEHDGEPGAVDPSWIAREHGVNRAYYNAHAARVNT